MINDLESSAWELACLQPSDLETLSAGVPEQGGTVALISPGTGLGEAFVTYGPHGPAAQASEGGHADFAPRSALENELRAWLGGRDSHVSYAAPDVQSCRRSDDRSMPPRIRRHGGSLVLERELRRAWFRYLAETRAAAPDDYVDVEEQAWRRLVSNLHALGMPIDHADCPPRVDARAGTQRVEA